MKIPASDSSEKENYNDCTGSGDIAEIFKKSLRDLMLANLEEPCAKEVVLAEVVKP